MSGRIAALLLVLLAGAPGGSDAAEVVKRVGRVTIRVDLRQAFPGGVAVVQLGGARIGSAWALLDGRRAPFYMHLGVPRALVPIASSAEPGPATLGVAVVARRREQRISVPIAIESRSYAVRSLALTEAQRGLLERPDVARDSRRLLGHLRTESPRPEPGPLRAPLSGEGSGYGETRVQGAYSVESRTDALGGERQRGLDFAVSSGTVVRAPGPGTVLFAGSLLLAGQAVVIDHGQGVVSVLQHLSRVSVSGGDVVSASTEIGLSGDTGLAPRPMLQWRVYLHGIAIDPRALAAILA